MRKRRSPRPWRASRRRCRATIYVYDNNSRDRTAKSRLKQAPSFATERQQGKGHVVRRMFADIDADVYVMADGDLTYDPAAAPAWSTAPRRAARHGRRHAAPRGKGRLSRRPRAREQAVYRPSSGLFGRSFSDIFSGYRVFSRRFVKSFPVLSDGFRDRNRDQRPRARTEDAGRRGRDELMARGRKAPIPSCRPIRMAGGS